jgi:poly(hydroxyalkanoate) granule-associated protein
MATKTKKVEEVVEESVADVKEAANPFVEALHKVLLASIGAVAIGKEELEDFVGKLVERGEIAEKDGKKLVKDVLARRKKEALKAEDMFSKRVEDTLTTLNVPSKTDVDALSEKVAALTKKVDELKKTS